MALSVIFASGEAILHGFAMVSLFIGLIGSGLWMQGAKNKKTRTIGVTMLISGVVLALALTVYYVSRPERRPF